MTPRATRTPSRRARRRWSSGSAVADELRYVAALWTDARASVEVARREIRAKEAAVEEMTRKMAWLMQEQQRCNKRDEFAAREQWLQQELGTWNDIHEKFLTQQLRHQAELKEET